MLHHIRNYRIFDRADNATPAVIAALSTMEDGDTLCLDGETLHLYPDGAHRAFYAISNNDAGDKPIAFPLIGRKNITVDGAGARLVFHGQILPFAIDRSENITVKNLTVDYSSPYYAQPHIIASDADGVLLHFDSPECGCRVVDGCFCFYSRNDGWEQICEAPLVLEFTPALVRGQPLMHKTNAEAVPSADKPPYFPYCGAPKDHGFLGGMFRDVTLTEVAPDTVRMNGNLGFVHDVGDILIMTHASREFPGIFLTDTKDTVIENVRLTYTSSMGVIAQMSENITLEGVVAEVEEGSKRILSVNADATHFVNCRGFIRMNNCRYTNMMDDACNIHGIYGIACGMADEKTVTVAFGHHQQEGIRFVKPGDTVAVIDRSETRIVAKLNIASSELVSMKELRIATADALPEAVRALDFASGDILIENLSTAPDVTVTNCISGYNRPRGYLLSSAGKIVIDNCTFYNMNCALQIGCEMCDWYESGAVTDVTVTNCHFDNSAYAGGVAIHIEPRLVKLPEIPFQGRIVIENNRITQCHPRILHAVSVKELVYKNNVFEADATLPAHGANGETGITAAHCGTVEIETE